MSKLIKNDVVAAATKVDAKRLTAADKAKITGVKTKAEQATELSKRAAKPHGGKPGQAVHSQSAKYEPGALDAVKASATKKPLKNAKGETVKPDAPKVSPDKITAVAGTRSGPPHIVVSAGGKDLVIPQNRFSGEVAKLAKVGASLKAVETYLKDHIPQAKLANGITGRDAPHASKAVGDQRAATPKAVQAKGPAIAKSPAKAKLPSKGADRSYTVLNRDHGARAGSKRAIQLDIVFKHTSTNSAKAAGAEAVDISFAEKQGFIKYS